MDLKGKFTHIFFDADDTLWENERYFREAEEQFIELLSDYTSPEGVQHMLWQKQEDNIPLFKKVWEPIVKLAEDKGVKIGFENCAGGGNIASLPYMWERMFDAIDSKNLGLEWEPAHAAQCRQQQCRDL